MNKKVFSWFLLSIVVACISLTSCSKDDEKGNPSVGNSGLVGIWKSQDGDIYELTGEGVIKVYDRYPSDYVKGSWKFDNPTLTIVVNQYVSGGQNITVPAETLVVKVVELTENTMTWAPVSHYDDNNSYDDEVIKFYRYNP